MKCRSHKLTAGEIALLKRDPRIMELFKTAKLRPLNIVEIIILNQLFAEAKEGKL